MFLSYSYFTNMLPKLKTKSKRVKEAANVPKRALSKIAKRAKFSVVTHHDLDRSQEAFDNETVIDSGLDMASRMDYSKTWITM